MKQLHDHAQTLVAVVGFFIPTCTLLVALRLWVRWRNRNWWWDDWLVLAGWALFVPSIALLVPAAYNGLGKRDGTYTPAEMSTAFKYFLLFQTLCLPAILLIRNSLLLTLRRLTPSRPLLALLALLALLNTASTLAALAYLLTNCRPLRGTWAVPPPPGTRCRPATSMVAVARAWSGVSVAVDCGVALLPVPLLRGARLRPAVKVAVGAILGLGVFASAATAVRIPALPLLAVREAYLENVGWIALWAFLETGVALCAAALTSLRPLLRGWLVGEGGGRGGYHRQWWNERGEGGSSQGSWGAVEKKWGRVLRLPARVGGGRGRGRRKESGRGGEFVGLEVCREWERGVQDSWETTVGGESSIGMRTVVEGGGDDVDAESQKSFVREGDIKVRKSISVEVPDE